MYVVEVAIAGINTNNETVNYLSPEKLSPGDLVSLKFRKKTYHALVIGISNVLNNKLAIKDLDFNLKSIDGVVLKKFLPKYMMDAVMSYSRNSLLSPKAVYEIMFPKEFKRAVEKADADFFKTRKKRSTQNYLPDKSALIAPYHKRISHIAYLIRHLFSQNKSLVIITNSEARISRMCEDLQKYSMARIRKITSKTGATSRRKIIAELSSDKKGCVLVTTPYNIMLAPKNTETVILEDESSSDYVRHIEPRINTKHFIEEYAKHFKSKVIFSDTLVSPSVFKRMRSGEVYPELEFSYKLNPEIKYSTVDMSDISYQSQRKIFGKSHHNHYIINRNFYENSQKLLDKNLKIFIFSPRKGGIPLTTCRDCGKTVTCDNCMRPLSLYRNENENSNNLFKCPRCGVKRNPENACSHCGGSIFYYLGVSTESIVSELQAFSPEINPIIIDAESGQSRKETVAKLHDFFKTPVSESRQIIVGTTYLFNLIRDKFDITIISSLDSIISSNDPDSHWQAAKILKIASEITSRKIILQTRHTDNEFKKIVDSKNLSLFVENELSVRQMFSNPPFFAIVKVTSQIPKNEYGNFVNFIKESLSAYRKNVLSVKERNGEIEILFEIHIPEKEYFEQISNENSPLKTSLSTLYSYGAKTEVVW